MERKYQRQYEDFSSVIPRAEDFPVLNSNSFSAKEENEEKEEICNITSPQSSFYSLFNNLKADDILLIAVLVLMLTDEKKDMSAILVIAALFMSEFFT